MSRDKLLLVLSQGLLIGCAVTLSVLAQVPWLSVAGPGMAGACGIAAVLTPSGARKPLRDASAAAAWLATLLAPAGLVFAKDRVFTFQGFWDYYYAWLAWLVAASLLPAGCRGGGAKTIWRALVLAWALLGNVLWLATAYTGNHPAAFYAGLLAALAWLPGTPSQFQG